MRAIILMLLVGCSFQVGQHTRSNRVCVLAQSTAKQIHEDITCEPVSFGETTDYAVLHVDSGEKWCHDAVSQDPAKDGGPLRCVILTPTAKEKAADDKARAEADAKAKIEADAKTKVEAEAKAKADLDAKASTGTGSGSGSAKAKP